MMDVFVLQVNASSDAQHVQLAKAKLDERANEYSQKKGAAGASAH